MLRNWVKVKIVQEDIVETVRNQISNFPNYREKNMKINYGENQRDKNQILKTKTIDFYFHISLNHQSKQKY